MKQSKHLVGTYNKETRYEAFEIKADGSRCTHYGGCSPLEAFAFMISKNRIGHTVILCDQRTDSSSLYTHMYPTMSYCSASAFSMQDTDFVNKVKVFAIQTPNFERR